MLKTEYPDKHKLLSGKVMVTPKIVGLNCTVNFSKYGMVILAPEYDIPSLTPIKELIPLIAQNRLKNTTVSIQGTVTLKNNLKRKVYNEFGLLPMSESLHDWIVDTIMRGDTDFIKALLEFVPWFIAVDSSAQYPNHRSMLEKLSNVGIPPVPYSVEDDPKPDDLVEMYQQLRQNMSVDGLIISNNGISLSEFEQTSLHYVFEPITITAVVDRMSWKTEPNGDVNPYAVFATPIGFSEENLTEYAKAHHCRFLMENGVGEGALVQVVFPDSEDDPPFIYRVDGSADFDIPTTCPTCGSLVYMNEPFLCCGSYDCTSKLRTPLYRMCHLVKNTSNKLVEEWLNSFPLQGGKTFIHGIIDFITLFKQAGAKSTSSRMEILMKEFGENKAQQLFDLENSLEIRFHQGFGYNEFWYIASLPDIGRNIANQLGLIDPQKLKTTKMFEILDNHNIHPNIVETLTQNMIHWVNLSRYIPIDRSMDG